MAARDDCSDDWPDCESREDAGDADAADPERAAGPSKAPVRTTIQMKIGANCFRKYFPWARCYIR